MAFSNYAEYESLDSSDNDSETQNFSSDDEASRSKLTKEQKKEQTMLGMFAATGDYSDEEDSRGGLGAFNNRLKSNFVPQSSEPDMIPIQNYGHSARNNKNGRSRYWNQKSEPKRKQEVKEVYSHTQKRQKIVTEEKPNTFEKYGMGAKMLSQMGYKEGEGLGAKKDGMANPISVKLRSVQTMGLGYGGSEKNSDNKEKVKKTETVEQVVVQKTRKTRIKTAKQLLEENENTVPAQKQIIIDMTGPESKVINNMNEFKSEPSGMDFLGSHALFPELRHNMDLIVEMIEKDILNTDKESRKDKINQEKLRQKKEHLASLVAEESVVLESLEVINTAVMNVKNALDKLSVCGESAFLEKLDELFKLMVVEDHKRKLINARSSNNDLHQKQAVEEYLYKLEHQSAISKKTNEEDWELLLLFVCSSLEAWLGTCIVDWDYNVNPGRFVPVLEMWMPLLYNENSVGMLSQKRSTVPYEAMLHATFLPFFRSLITNEFDVRNPDVLITLLQVNKTVFPFWFTDMLIETQIIPKISYELEHSWDPRRDASPIHSWIFPWLPVIPEDNLRPVLDIIRSKLTIVLQSWTLENSLNLIHIWKNVFSTAELNKMLHCHILPKLYMIMEKELIINPRDQEYDIIMQVMKWKELIEAEQFAELLKNTFFPKFRHVLEVWMTAQNCNYDNVADWLLSWKKAWPKGVVRHLTFKKEMRRCFDSINAILS